MQKVYFAYVLRYIYLYIEFVLAMEIFLIEGISCIPRCYGSSVPMATRLKQ